MMLQKILIIFISFWLFSFNLHGQDYYVWASKLNLRTVPNGEVISKISWGDKVKVIERFSSETFDTLHLNLEYKYWINNKDTIVYHPFSLWGEWVKIETGDNTGYVFDAYLSKIPPPKRIKNNRFEPFDDYFEREFGISFKEKIGSKGYGDNYQELISKDKSIELLFGLKGKGGINKFIFQNLPLKEGKLIGYQLFRHYLGGECDFSVYKKDEKVIVEGFCSC